MCYIRKFSEQGGNKSPLKSTKRQTAQIRFRNLIGLAELCHIAAGRPELSDYNYKEFNMSKILTGALLSTAFVFGASMCLADEERSSTVQATTPAGTASTSVQSKTNAAGSSTAVNHTSSNAAGTQSATYKAKAGPGGAKVSATKTNVQGNADGSVTANQTHESHAVGEAGSVHHKSAASTTVGADGSTATVKHSATSTNP
jgi:hypothetical protein